MSDITINSNENQEDNQKTTPVTGSLSEQKEAISPRSSAIINSWLGSTKNLEPISSVMAAEPCRLSPGRLAGARARSPHQKNPLPYFFEFPPAEISFLVVKGVSGGGVSL